jgi:tetratricopeptide (TPR) repeat protein
MGKLKLLGMKKLFFTLLFTIYIVLSSFAFNIDVSAEERVDSLLREAREMLESNPDNALVILDEALTLAIDGDFMKAHANALNYKGLIYYDKKDYGTAIKYFQDALKVLFRIGDKEKVANMMKKIGLAYLNQKKYTKTIEYYNFALKIFEQLGHLGREASTHVEVGIINRISGRYSDAVEQFNVAIEIYKKLDNKAGQAESKHHLAKTFHEMGHLKKADNLFKETLELYNTYLDYSGLSTVLNNYGSLLIDLEMYDRAEEILKEAIEQSNEDQSLMYGKIAANYGTVQVYQSNFEDAEYYLMQALNIGQKKDDNDLVAQVYRMLYELNFRNNDTKKALVFYQKYIAAKDTTATSALPELKSVQEGDSISNIMIFFTVFSALALVVLIIWLIIVIKQRDKALEELKKYKK